MSDVEVEDEAPMNLGYADSEAEDDLNVAELNDGVESLNDVGDEDVYDETDEEDLEDDDDDEGFTSGSESAYEEDEDIRPPPENVIVGEKKTRGRPRKDVAGVGGGVMEKRKKKRDKGKGKQRALVEDEEEDDIFE
jgi:hypothetical protein